jgi:hypothetical protein
LEREGSAVDAIRYEVKALHGAIHHAAAHPHGGELRMFAELDISKGSGNLGTPSLCLSLTLESTAVEVGGKSYLRGECKERPRSKCQRELLHL